MFTEFIDMFRKHVYDGYEQDVESFQCRFSDCFGGTESKVGATFSGMDRGQRFRSCNG